jgi:hypothetical protein
MNGRISTLAPAASVESAGPGCHPLHLQLGDVFYWDPRQLAQHFLRAEALDGGKYHVNHC